MDDNHPSPVHDALPYKVLSTNAILIKMKLCTNLLCISNFSDFVTLSEMWLNASICYLEVVTEGYKHFRSDRQDSRPGGGESFFF